MKNLRLHEEERNLLSWAGTMTGRCSCVILRQQHWGSMSMDKFPFWIYILLFGTPAWKISNGSCDSTTWWLVQSRITSWYNSRFACYQLCTLNKSVLAAILSSDSSSFFLQTCIKSTTTYINCTCKFDYCLFFDCFVLAIQQLYIQWMTKQNYL